MIKKIKLNNYKKFKKSEFVFNAGRNILVGENGVGKSSVLQAISLVLSGSYSRIESIGLESLFNVEVISNFLVNSQKIEELPELIVELYFSEKYSDSASYDINGKYNTERIECDGLQLKISADCEEYFDEISEVLSHDEPSFPFDYYKVEFTTFGNKSYNTYKKRHKIKHSTIDTTSMNQTIATKNYVSQLFVNQSGKQRQKISHEFRELSKNFSQKMYDEYMETSDDEYRLKVKNATEKHFSDMLTDHKNEISIENLGLGERVLLGVKSSLDSADEDVQVVLVEEPENHLSYLNMHKLIEIIEGGDNSKQMFIATHSNMIASRLELKNIILIGSDAKKTDLTELTAETSRFFTKAPNSNVLNFILAKKAILIEGDAEYILLEKFYEMIREDKPFADDVAIISCGGKSFKRYLEIAKILDKRVAVITDNDSDFEKNITESYKDFRNTNIEIFSDRNDENWTFEVCLYNTNKIFYDTTFKTGHMINGALEYMIGKAGSKSSKGNKAEAAFRLLEILENGLEKFVIPGYIREAVEWVNPKND
ncbi:ATP-dependent endonuclease [Lactococcus lactis]|uniref:ATP-dependent nuclease n=1 Tax=Lactococcus lactis TaxID=1358 RepID=UPI0021AE9C8C|nr:TOPRIM nucleotidyl transferase/hydrolase domain-containing protein [Lactococcus lactis]MCT1182753.1 ATP-dependent endonuclease [Lactococcus lactis]